MGFGGYEVDRGDFGFNRFGIEGIGFGDGDGTKMMKWSLDGEYFIKLITRIGCSDTN